MSSIAYFRVSTADQSIESQRHSLLKDAPDGGFDDEYQDEGVSGSVMAADRPGFAKLLAFIRKGDVLYVSAVDRLGRDAIDIQTTVRGLLDKGVKVYVQGLGLIARGVGELILAVLAQVAEMERRRIVERTTAGRSKARESLAATGLTHKGKASLGRPLGRVSGHILVPSDVAQWRYVNEASISETASTWQLSESTVKRYCLAHPAASPIPEQGS